MMKQIELKWNVHAEPTLPLTFKPAAREKDYLKTVRYCFLGKNPIKNLPLHEWKREHIVSVE